MQKESVSTRGVLNDLFIFEISIFFSPTLLRNREDHYLQGIGPESIYTELRSLQQWSSARGQLSLDLL